MSEEIGIAALIVAAYTGYQLLKASPVTAPATLFFHIKHADYPNTLGKVQQIYGAIKNANKTGRTIGLEPQVTADWATTLQYLSECGDAPVMLNVFTSDDSLQLSLEQIAEAMTVCNVKYLRFHEVLSFYDPFPTAYAQSILAFAKEYGVPVFWNEWNIYTHPQIAQIIQGYEDNVLVSFGTNSNQVEPIEGFELLQQFQRKAASVQSWYYWERNNRLAGYELLMPPTLMAQHTSEAFQAGCEIVQYEPFSYFFDANAYPKTQLATMLSRPF